MAYSAGISSQFNFQRQAPKRRIRRKKVKIMDLVGPRGGKGGGVTIKNILEKQLGKKKAQAIIKGKEVTKEVVTKSNPVAHTRQYKNAPPAVKKAIDVAWLSGVTHVFNETVGKKMGWQLKSPFGVPFGPTVPMKGRSGFHYRKRKRYGYK